jgi:hypothetical protein
MAQVEGQLRRPGGTPADEQGDLRAARGNEGPVVPAAALGAVPAAQPRPGSLRQRRRQGAGTAAARGRRDDVVAGDRQHVADLLFLKEGAQRPVVAVGLVGRDPGERDARGDGPLDHRLQELRLGPERRGLRRLRGCQAALVSCPGAGQVELPVDQRVALRRRVGQEDAELAVRDLACGARVLPLHPGRAGPFLLEPVSSPIRTPSGSPSAETT